MKVQERQKKVKCFFIVSSFFVLIAGIYAAQLNLPKIKTSISEEKPVINETGKVIPVQSPGLKFSKNSSSALLAVPGKEFIWTPSELESRTTGGADIYCAFLTGDASAAVIAERIGGAGKPNGLRIIVTDIASGKVIRASKIMDVKLHYAAMLSHDKLIAAVSSPGTDDEKIRIAKIDIVSESIEFGEVISDSPALFAASWSYLYVCIPDKKLIKVYDTFDLTLAANCSIARTDIDGISLTPDFKQLAVYGNDSAEIFDAEIHNNTLYSSGKYSLPGASFSKCAPIKKDLFVFFSPGRPASLLTNGDFVSLNIRCGEIFTVNPSSGTLVIENHTREFEVFRFPELRAVQKYAPRKMRPITRNDSIAIFFTPGKKEQKLILLDHRGNLWKIELKGKRGQKHPILVVDNTGLK